MVGILMARFGEPTATAHGQLIYWAFDESGKIADAVYEEAKAAGSIEVLATVKFNSTLDLIKVMDNQDTEETGTIYYIITSDRLLDRYVSSQ